MGTPTPDTVLGSPPQDVLSGQGARTLLSHTRPSGCNHLLGPYSPHPRHLRERAPCVSLHVPQGRPGHISEFLAYTLCFSNH